MLSISASPSFSRIAKKLHAKDKLNTQETLLAYELKPDKLNPSELVLLAVGSHENFYAALKR